jgi:dTDP-4-dehydrorhamnose 3,5-epimerase-like enzyme
MSLKNKIKILSRRLISDDRGWFLKAITGTEDLIPDNTGEVYLTMAKPGQAKGGHYHPKAVEWFTLVQGNATLKLFDLETEESLIIPLSFDNPQTVFVPNNIAHIFINDSDSDFILLAYTNLLYSPEDTIAFDFENK